MTVLTPQDKGVTLDAILRVGELPSWHATALEMVLVRGTMESVVLAGHTRKPLGEGLLLAFPAGCA